jgi:hypothetical protein
MIVVEGKIIAPDPMLTTSPLLRVVVAIGTLAP